MQILIHVSSHYDWDPVPSDVEVTPDDISSRRVKPTVDGKWLMRTKRDVATHTQATMPEQQIIAYILGEAVRSHTVLSRKEAVAQYLSRHVMPHHAHRKWVTNIEISDEAPELSLFDKELQVQVQAGTIDSDDVDALRKAYLEPTNTEEYVSHLRAHFGVKESSSS